MHQPSSKYQGMKAKRGDIIVIERVSRGYVISEGSYERTEYEVGIVTGISLEGEVKAMRSHYGDSRSMDRIIGRQRTFIVSKGEIDVESAAKAAWDNPWPHAPEHKGKPFDSLDEVRACLSPFKYDSVVAAAS